MTKTTLNQSTATETQNGNADNADNIVLELFGTVAPGAMIIEVLAECDVTPRQAASTAGIDYETFFGIMTGVEPITESLAKRLPKSVRGDAAFWLRVEEAYQEDLLRDGLRRPEYDPVEAERVADQVLGPAEDGLTEMELPVFYPEEAG